MIYEQAHAKINLSLDVTGKRDDGYHLVRMIMQTLELCDDLSFEKGAGGTGITLITNNDTLNEEQNSGKDNLIVKAVKKLEEYTGRKFDVVIKLSKYIPLAAGMAGGSADAAATLRGINRLYELGLTTEELCNIAVKIGADVPFCVEGGLMLCEGIGEILTRLQPLQKLPVVICKPNVAVSTPMVYKMYDDMKDTCHPDVDKMLGGIERYEYKTVVESMKNALEPVTVSIHPVISEIEENIEKTGALKAMMSGSGPTVFGIYESMNEAKASAEKIKAIYPEFFICATTFHNLPKEHFA